MWNLKCEINNEGPRLNDLNATQIDEKKALLKPPTQRISQYCRLAFTERWAVMETPCHLDPG